MNLRRNLGVPAFALALSLAFAGNALASQAPVPLADAAPFGALSKTAMTNVGLDTVVNGDIGSSGAIGIGVTHPAFAAYAPPASQLANGQASLTAAYLNAEAQTPTGNITGTNLAGQTLLPGVYNSTGSILISGPTALTLDGNGNADAVFIFQAAAGGDLTVDPTSTVSYINGAQPCNVFWKVQSAFLKNSGFKFIGTILALTQITLTDSITVEGRVLARNADVTFIHDVVNVPTTCTTQASITEAARVAAEAEAAARAAAEQAAAAAAALKAADEAKAAAAAALQAQVTAALAWSAANQAAIAKAAKAAAAEAAADAKIAAAAAKKAARLARVAAAQHTLARLARRHVGLTG